MEMAKTRELGMEFVIACQSKNEIYKRNKKAQSYCAKVRRRREQKVESIKNFLCVIAVVIGIILAIVFSNGNTNTNGNIVMRGELQGNHVVLTDGTVCEVDKANANYTREPMQVYVTIDHNGNVLDVR
jgi:hypothetical protein